MILQNIKLEQRNQSYKISMARPGQHMMTREVRRVSSTVMWHQVPPESREPCLLRGYRPIGTSFRDCLKSVFQSHNETGNIWTHILGSLYFLHQAYCNVQNDRKKTDWSHASLLAVWNFGCFCMFFTSTMAHTFNCMSVKSRKICFMVDYFGISAYVSCTAMIYFAAFPREVFWGIPRDLYLPIAAAQIPLINCLCSWSFVRKTTWKHGTKCRACCFGTPYITGTIPAAVYMFSRYGLTFYTAPMGFIFTKHVCVFLIGALLYGNCIPEKMFPSTFDIWGQSHQIFHICGMLGTRYQYMMLLELCQRTNPDLPQLEMAKASWWTILIIVNCLLPNIYFTAEVIKEGRLKWFDWLNNNENEAKISKSS